MKLPGYARVDGGALLQAAAAGSRRRSIVENILGAHYFPTANADNNIAPGAPRTVKATVGYRFYAGARPRAGVADSAHCS